MHCERTGRNVLTLRHPVAEPGWSQRYLLSSRRAFRQSVMRQAAIETASVTKGGGSGAGVMCFGDWFRRGGGRSDLRRSKTGVRDAHNADNYLDLIVDDSAEFLSRNAIQFSGDDVRRQP